MAIDTVIRFAMVSLVLFLIYPWNLLVAAVWTARSLLDSWIFSVKWARAIQLGESKDPIIKELIKDKRDISYSNYVLVVGIMAFCDAIVPVLIYLASQLLRS